MKSKLLAAMVGMALLGSQASASTLVGTTSAATGIDGLIVDGVTYNVTFVHDTYNKVYASTPPTFLGNQQGANVAAIALAAALNDLLVTGLIDINILARPQLITPSPPFLPYFVYGFTAQLPICRPAPAPCSALKWGINSYFDQSTTAQEKILDFTIYNLPTAETPLPASIAFFVPGLVGLGLLVRRGKRKAAALAA
jgi:hypothetical protein